MEEARADKPEERGQPGELPEEEVEKTDDEANSPSLPSDLPRSLNDIRQPLEISTASTYMDPWTGEEVTTTSPQPMATTGGASVGIAFGDDDEVDSILRDPVASDVTRKERLQTLFSRAASSGDVTMVDHILNGPARGYIDLNMPDDTGTTPLIYATCFGNQQIVRLLLDAGADVDAQDRRNKWTALIWATNSNSAELVKDLIKYGASRNLQSSTGRTAADFIAPDAHDDIVESLRGRTDSSIGHAGVGDREWDHVTPSTLYDERNFELQMAEEDMRRRMMEESNYNLEVDLGALGLDQPQDDNDDDGLGDASNAKLEQEWQFFVFSERDIPRMMQVLVREMQPLRSNSQRPVPANVLFLSMRYAALYGGGDLLRLLVEQFFTTLEEVITEKAQDMTILAFWMSNCTILLFYLQRDEAIVKEEASLRDRMEQAIRMCIAAFVSDSERRIGRQLESCVLEYEQIEGLSDVRYESDWSLFRRSRRRNGPNTSSRPPSPRARADPSPRNITSLLSSTLFVMDAYDIHPTIVIQVLSQIYYRIGAELFNSILRNRQYHARSKAMEIRFNLSSIEDWAIYNNRKISSEAYQVSNSLRIPSVSEYARTHLATLVQLLQWLQCLSCLSDDIETIKATVTALHHLSAAQLLKVAREYRQEVGEPRPSKDLLNYLRALNKEQALALGHGEKFADRELELDPDVMLQIDLPKPVDLIITYGSGIGGMNKERERQYQPYVPADIIDSLDIAHPGPTVDRRTLPSELFSDEANDDAQDPDESYLVSQWS